MVSIVLAKEPYIPRLSIALVEHAPHDFRVARLEEVYLGAHIIYNEPWQQAGQYAGNSHLVINEPPGIRTSQELEQKVKRLVEEAKESAEMGSVTLGTLGEMLSHNGCTVNLVERDPEAVRQDVRSRRDAGLEILRLIRR